MVRIRSKGDDVAINATAMRAHLCDPWFMSPINLK